MRSVTLAVALLTMFAGTATGQRISHLPLRVTLDAAASPTHNRCSGTRVGAVAKGFGIGLGIGIGALILARPDGLTNEHARQNARMIALGVALVGGAYEWFHYGATHRDCERWLPGYTLMRSGAPPARWPLAALAAAPGSRHLVVPAAPPPLNAR